MLRNWNTVISVQEKGFKKAFDVLSEFGEVKRTEFFNVLLMRADDISLMLDTLKMRWERDPDSLGFLARLIPVPHSFVFKSPEEFEAKSKEVVLGWAGDLMNKAFHVRLRRRGFKGRISSPDEERFLDEAVLEALEKSGGPGRIDFENPDAIIAIETVGTWAGLGLFRREEWEKYPFIRV